MSFKLRFPARDIRTWAAAYDYPAKDDPICAIGQSASLRGCLTRDEFLEMALWKSHRPRKRCERNPDDYVREVSRAAFASRDPRFKIEVLRLLDGVDWPSASVILHFCDREAWPIMDFRAFWSLGEPSPVGRYSFALWEEYTRVTRSLAAKAGVDMRTLDRALWAYSKKNQPAGA